MHALDLSLFYFLNNLAGQSHTLDSVIVFCGDYLAYLVGALFLVFLYVTNYPWRQKMELMSVALVSVVLSRGLITELIRHFYHRPRPFVALNLDQVHKLLDDSAWSFPSGHATFFFALATVVYLYNRRWGVWFFALATLITLGRVAAGVHYPSDILAGAAIGVASAWLIYKVSRPYFQSGAHQTY